MEKIKGKLFENKKISLLFFYLILFSFFFINGVQNIQTGLVEGWFPLAVSRESDLTQLEKELGQITQGNYLGANKAFISYYDYGQKGQVSVQDIIEENKLISVDPRIDLFMKKVHTLFQYKNRQFYYLPATRSARSYYKELQSLPRAYHIDMPDYYSPQLPLLFLFVLGLFSCLYSKRLLFILLPHTFFLFKLYLCGYTNVILWGALIDLILIIQSPKSSRFSSLFLLLSMGLCIYFDSLPLYSYGFYLVLFIGWEFLNFDISPKKQTKRNKEGRHFSFSIKKREHELFQPVLLSSYSFSSSSNIHKGTTKTLYNQLNLLYLVMIFLLSGILFISMSPKRRSIASFVSRSKVSSTWNYDTLHLLGEGVELVQGSDYIRHLIFQETYPFGGIYKELPKLGDSFKFPNYVKKEGSLVLDNKEIFFYDQLWLDREVQSAQKTSLGSFLLPKAGPSKFRLANTIDNFYSVKEYMLYISLFIFGFVLLVLSSLHQAKDREVHYKIRNYIMGMRRKQQAA